MTLRYTLSLAALFVATTAFAQSSSEEGTAQTFLNQTHIGGYAEMALFHDNGQSARLDIPRFVIYLDHYFSDAWVFKSETEIEHVKIEGGEGGEVALEQAFIDWHHSSSFGWRVGLLLIPMGIINQTHEPNTFYSVERPIVDEAVIPTTWREIGTGVYGELTEGLKYQAYISEGLKPAAELYDLDYAKQEGASDAGEGSNAAHPAVSAKLDYAPIAGLRLGLAGYYQPNAFESIGLESSAFLMSAIDAQYSLSALRLRAEAVLAKATNADTLDLQTTKGAYVEAAYNILSLINPSATAELLPFARYETLSFRDPYYVTAGVAYKPLDNVILKADYRFSNSEIVAEKGKLSLGAGVAF